MVNTRTQSWIPFAIAAAGVALAVTLTVVAYKSSVQTAVLRSRLSQSRYDVSRLDAIVGDMQKYSLPIATMLGSLPLEHRDVAIALVSMENAASASSVDLEMRVDDTAKPDASGVKSLAVTQQVSGSYQAVRTYLSALSRLPYHTRTQTMTMDTTGSVVSAQVTMKFFIR